MVVINGLEPTQKAPLSAFCRRVPRGAEPPTISSNNITKLISMIPQYTPPEKLDSLLERMGRMSAGLGEYTTFDPAKDYPLVIAKNAGEVNFLTRELQRRGYVDGTLEGFYLTSSGWERLEQIRKSGPTSNRVFVAMWFQESMSLIYDEAIAPAIRESGYDPLRIDRHEHVNRIDDEIIAQIRRSRFMVADFTGQRYGVYFEAGIMLGLGRTVIWMCDKKELDGEKLHFDVRQFNFIDYESVQDARKRLYNRILAIEGEGPGQFEKPG
ncbi:MAG: hypothetical protein LAP13_17545 [Acidobacteriia bacterium]|nr:hypothetical protein [Terriglobia bacterium]